MPENYYKILSVEPTASQKEIQEAADRLTSFWNEKQGLSYEKQSEILSQIRKARVVLTDPLERHEYDMEQGFKSNFSEQILTKRKDFIPVQFSESIESLVTVKIPGQLDFEELERSLATMGILTQVKEKPNFKPYSVSEPEINCFKNQLLFNEKNEVIATTSKLRSVENLQFPSYDKKSFDTSSNTDINMKRHDFAFFNNISKLHKYKGANISQNDETRKSASNEKVVCESNSHEVYVKEISKEPDDITQGKNCNNEIIPPKKDVSRISLQKKLSHSDSRQDLEINETETPYLTPKELATINKYIDLLVPSKNRSSRRHTEPDIGSNSIDKFNERSLSLSATDIRHKSSGRTIDAISIVSSVEELSCEEDVLDRTLKEISPRINLTLLSISEDEQNSKDYPKTKSASDIQENLTVNFGHNSPTVNSKNNANEEENSKMSPNWSKYKLTAVTLKKNLNDAEDSKIPLNPSKDFSHNSPTSNSKNNPNDQGNVKMPTNFSKNFRDNSQATNFINNPNDKKSSKMPSNIFEEESGKSATPQNQIVPNEDIAGSSDIDKENLGRKIMKNNERDSFPMSSNERKSFPSGSSVSATTRMCGRDIKTVYSFGSDTDCIDVFVNDELRVRIVKDQKQNVYCTEMQQEDLSPSRNITASTVIAANNCIITTKVTRRRNQESISVCKNGVLLCRTESSILEE